MWERIETSLRQYATAWGRWAWWLVVGVIMVLVDLYLRATHQASMPSRAWVALGFIVLILVPFIVFHKSRLERDGLRQEIARLIAESGRRPKVVTHASSEDIVVQNQGAKASFRAEIRVLEQWNFEAVPVGLVLPGFWRNSLKSETEIFNGQEDRLYLRSLSQTPAPGGAVTGSLNLHYFNRQGHNLDKFPQAFMLYSDDPPVNTGLLIQVTISSTPEMTDGPVVRTYRLTREGLYEQT
jgi:hypothetical protein